MCYDIYEYERIMEEMRQLRKVKKETVAESGEALVEVKA